MAKLTITLEDFQNTVYARTSLKKEAEGPLTQAQKLAYSVLMGLQNSGVQVLTAGEKINDEVKQEDNVIDFVAAYLRKRGEEG